MKMILFSLLQCFFNLNCGVYEKKEGQKYFLPSLFLSSMQQTFSLLVRCCPAHIDFRKGSLGNEMFYLSIQIEYFFFQKFGINDDGLQLLDIYPSDHYIAIILV